MKDYKKMIDDKTLIGKRFWSNINNFKFQVVDIKNDNGTIFIVLEDIQNKSKYEMTAQRFDCMLITEMR